jgi:hypothetical protein
LNLEAFCYLGLLRFAEQLDPVLELLPEDEREKALNFLSDVKELPKSELSRRWSKLRSDEFAVVRQSAEQRGGVSVEKLPPALREFWLDWIRDHHG